MPTQFRVFKPGRQIGCLDVIVIILKPKFIDMNLKCNMQITGDLYTKSDV
jgi:hypothetical protein